MNRSIEIRENVPLAPLTTLGVGGPARYFARALTETHVREALDFAGERDLNVFVLGGGSNVLVADQGFNGLVINVDIKGVEITDDLSNPDFVTIRGGAGEDWDEFVAFCVGKNLAGIECLSGIPGFIGGTPVQNVGAYGQEVSETIVSVKCFDRHTRKILELTYADCKFTYRASIFNTTEKGRFIVLGVTYLLKKGGRPKVVYPELKKMIESSIYAGSRDDSGIRDPFLGEVRDAVLKIRRAKSMLIDEGDPNSRSAGSFFKNPIVSNEKFSEIAGTRGFENVPSFRIDSEHIKISAAWLIEKSGFYKGYRSGNVGISTKHMLAIINLGGGTAGEIIALKNDIQVKTREKFDIELVPEPDFIGFEKS